MTEAYKYPCEDGFIFMRVDDSGLLLRKAIGEDLQAPTITVEQAYELEFGRKDKP